MSNSISQAHSLEQVVEIINNSHEGYASAYFGGTDTRDAQAMAGQYAWEAASASGYTSDETIEAYLDILVEHGAKFDFKLALENAIARKKS